MQPSMLLRPLLTRRLQGWGSKIIDTKQKFPRKGESFLESAHAAAASAMGALNPDNQQQTDSSSKQRLLR